jgi:hypothetical protein
MKKNGIQTIYIPTIEINGIYETELVDIDLEKYNSKGQREFIISKGKTLDIKL